MNLTNKNYNNTPILESVTDEKEISKRFKKGLRQFVTSYSNTVKGSTTISYGGRPVKAVPADIVRIASELKHGDLSDLLIRNIILNFIVSSEKHSAYSGALLMQMMNSNIRNSKLTISRRSEPSHVNQLIRRYMGNGICSNIISNILEINPNASLEFRVSRNKKRFSVLSDYSMKLAGHVPAGFLLKSQSLKGFYPIFLDGKIENVSEIDSLLRSSHENSQSILLMSRQFSPDVISTLNHNYENNKLSVVPFVFSEDEYDKLTNEKIKVFDSQNIFELGTFDSGDLKKSYDSNIHRGCINFHGAEGLGRHVVIDIPGHFSNQSGLIEDRVRSGITFALEVAKNGIVLDDNGKAIAGNKQYNTSCKVYDALIGFENKIGGLIVLE